MNNEQLAVSNVVFQYCHGEVRDAKDYLAFGVHGEGDAIVFTGGKAIKGTWSRMEGDSVPPKFYDEDGNEIILTRGKHGSVISGRNSPSLRNMNKNVDTER